MECAGEKILKIGQYLVKMWTKVCGFLFRATLYVRVCVVYVEWSAAVLFADVHRGVGHSRAALHFYLFRGCLERPTHNMGQADVSHVGLRTQS